MCNRNRCKCKKHCYKIKAKAKFCKSVKINGDLTVKRDTCLGRKDILKVIDYPMSPIPVTEDPKNNPFQGSVEANGLRFTYVPSGDPGVKDGPWYFTDKEGHRVLQAGIEEDNPYYNGPEYPSDQPPVFDTNARINITSTQTDPKIVSKLLLKLRWSVELGNFDFLIVEKNGVEIFREADFNTSNATSFLKEDLIVDLLPSDVLTVRFLKDEDFYGGLDSIYFFIESSTLEFKTDVEIKADLDVGCDLNVGGNVDIGGDLDVEGVINNLELEILKDCFVPPTDEVYSQQYVQGPNIRTPVLEIIEDFTISPSAIIPGTEPDPSKDIYGYDNGNLDLTGGPEKSYNEQQVEDFNYRYHNSAPVVFTQANMMKNIIERCTSYSYQRGLAIPGKDLYPQYEGQFVFYDNTLLTTAMKFVFSGGDPIFLDLIGPRDRTYIGIDLYEPDENNFIPGRAYPLRIPITTSFSEFNDKYGKEPIVYHDVIKRKITVNVPDNGNPFKFSLGYARNSNDSYLINFSGTYSFMRRDPSNTLVSSAPSQAQYLVQASSLVTGTTVRGPDVRTANYNIFGNSGLYTGMVLSILNGGTDAFDTYNYQSSNLVGFVSLTQPGIYPEDFDNGFDIGDNPVTEIIENMGLPSTMNISDNTLWVDFRIIMKVTSDMAKGLTYPEENPLLPNATLPTDEEILSPVVLHEFIHNQQNAQGVISALPAEGCATAFESDQRFIPELLVTLRTFSRIPYVFQTVRGKWPVLVPESGTPPDPLTGESRTQSYGQDIFWKKFSITQGVDPNYQTLRRLSDILTNETIGPALESSPFEFPTSSGWSMGNATGNNLAYQKAMDEILGLDLKQEYADFAVSLAMLRNNTSIPDRFRTHYPHWLWSESYPDHEGITSLIFGTGTLFDVLSTWWDYTQNNNVMPTIGDKMYPELTSDVTESIADLSCLIYQVDKDTVTSIDVEVIEGEWQLAMIQFTSDGTPSGIFSIDGLHQNNGGVTNFDVTQFTDSGYVRLICANVSINGTLSADIFQWFGPTPITGTVKITVN